MSYHDDFDDHHEEHDDELHDVDLSNPSPPHTEVLLRRVIEIIDTSPGLPMSASVRVNKDDVIVLLEDALTNLPEELRAARWLLKERDEMLARTRRDADDIIAEAKARVAQMVQRTEVVKAAELRARQLVDRATAEARKIRLSTEDYCDQKLASFEIVLERINRTVAAGRQKLQATSILEAELAPDDADDDAVSAFFDQDDG